ncbi:hypothetical protein EVA_11951 [gut metagenome]|uniref:Uncharacterized protein n=1 Tax=gut metagenome TaxID=749906 RepID=J9GDS1_9ZZZZ
MMDMKMSRKRWLILIISSIVFVVFILPMVGVGILQGGCFTA